MKTFIYLVSLAKPYIFFVILTVRLPCGRRLRRARFKCFHDILGQNSSQIFSHGLDQCFFVEQFQTVKFKIEIFFI